METQHKVTPTGQTRQPANGRNGSKFFTNHCQHIELLKGHAVYLPLWLFIYVARSTLVRGTEIENGG